tara:strand:+ start:209 stop:913 length:705 start_codon:yes stop_codon:yes gene_type:complete
MNQNPGLVVTPNSITLEIMKVLFLLKRDDTFLNFPEEQSLDNILNEVYNLYYKHWNYKIIIDRGCVCTPGNLMVMQKHFKQPIRCIVILRDVLDVLASYIKWFETEPTSFLNEYKTIDEKLSKVMYKNGAVAKELMSIQYLLQHPEMAVFIKYDDLVQNPEQEIKKVYSFLNIPYYQHRFVNLDQITVNGIQYNDTITGKNMHTIRTDKIMKEENYYKDMIPERFIRKYGHITF